MKKQDRTECDKSACNTSVPFLRSCRSYVHMYVRMYVVTFVPRNRTRAFVFDREIRVSIYLWKREREREMYVYSRVTESYMPARCIHILSANVRQKFYFYNQYHCNNTTSVYRGEYTEFIVDMIANNSCGVHLPKLSVEHVHRAFRFRRARCACSMRGNDQTAESILFERYFFLFLFWIFNSVVRFSITFRGRFPVWKFSRKILPRRDHSGRKSNREINISVLGSYVSRSNNTFAKFHRCWHNIFIGAW